MNSNPTKQAVVISGGASQGAYHIGVLKALCEGSCAATGPAGQPNAASARYKKLVPDILTGTSSGAFNAAMLLGEIENGSPDPIGNLEEVWLSRIARTGTSCGSGAYRLRGNPARFLDFGCLISNPFEPVLDLFSDTTTFASEAVSRGRQFLTSTERIGQRVLDQLNVSSFLSMDRYERVIKDSVKFDLVRHSERHLSVAAIRWDTGFTKYFSNEDISIDSGPRIIMASSAVPGLFSRVEIDGVEYGDSLFVENSPLQGAVEANADVIHVISSFPKTANIPRESTVNTLDTLYRMLVINVSKSIRRDIERYRNVNDALLVIEKLRNEGCKGQALLLLKQIVNRIMRQEEPDYRRIEIHVHKPPEPIANLIQFLNFDKEYIEALINKGYYDTITHNCELNGCVVPRADELDTQPFQPATSYGSDDREVRVAPGIAF